VIEQAQEMVKTFLKGLDSTKYEKFRMDLSVVPPILIYEDGENFIALDPAANKYYIDKLFNVGFELNMNSDPEILTRVDEAGRAAMDKGRASTLSQWLENTTL